MTLFFNIDPWTMDWIVLPLIVFFSRVMDVSMSTIRIMLIVNERKLQASLLSFFEMFVWLIAVTQVLQNLNNWITYVAFAGGFASGTYLGMLIEKKLSIGIVLIRAVTVQKDGSELTAFLRSHKFRITSLDAEGNYGKVNIIYTVVNRSEMKLVIDTIKKFNPNAFYTVENIRYVSDSDRINLGIQDQGVITFLKRIKVK